MSKPIHTDDQEIDLSALRDKFDSFIDGINAGLFGLLQFLIRNAIIIILLFVIGAALGFYVDRSQKMYNNEVIVTPNFGSVDYLYTKLALLESKIKDRDTIFLNQNGFQNAGRLVKIEVEPITDLYPFINRTQANFEMIKLMSEDSDMKNIVEDPVTAKNFSFHKITFVTKSKTTKAATLEPLLRFLNNSDYYAKLQKEYANNLSLKMSANDQTINQINGLLDKFSSSNEGRNASAFYYNENSQINEIIKTKDELVREQGSLRIESVNIDKIVKDSAVLLNIEDEKSLNGKLKFVLPLLFVGLFIVIKLFMSFYKKQALIVQKQA